jgi:hypothetical protein
MVLREVQRMEGVRTLIADPHTTEHEVAERAYLQLAQVGQYWQGCCKNGCSTCAD